MKKSKILAKILNDCHELRQIPIESLSNLDKDLIFEINQAISNYCQLIKQMEDYDKRTLGKN
jgi:hypothetical protein